MYLSQCELNIDLKALVANWQYMAERSAPSRCAAVVKANAYGLGVEEVSKALVAAGCRTLMVASIDEAAQIRRSLDKASAEIFVLSGVFAGDEPAFESLHIKPVLCSFSMLRRWAVYSSGRLPSALKIDTGMGRLGLTEGECERVLARSSLLSDAGVEWVFSHLACSDEPEHPLNVQQLQNFENWKARFVGRHEGLRFSLANSAGILLGKEYAYDMVRPGIALYGGMREAALQPVLELSLPIIQIKNLPAGATVGYGAVHQFSAPAKVAVVTGGYADGIFRSLGGKGLGHVLGVQVPMVGRVSMDTTIFDVTNVEGDLVEGDLIEVLGPNISLCEQAERAGTISYELLTAMSQRYRRVYRV